MRLYPALLVLLALVLMFTGLSPLAAIPAGAAAVLLGRARACAETVKRR